MGYALAHQVNAIKYLESSCKPGKVCVRAVVYEAVWTTLCPDEGELSNSENVQECCQLA